MNKKKKEKVEKAVSKMLYPEGLTIEIVDNMLKEIKMQCGGNTYWIMHPEAMKEIDEYMKRWKFLRAIDKLKKANEIE